MGRKKTTRTLDVYLNHVHIGALKRSSSGLIEFSYTNAWLEAGFAISLSLPLQEESFKGEVVTRFFDNLLPDNDEIKKSVATKLGAESTRPFDMLEVIGRECVGALSFHPEGFTPKNAYALGTRKVKSDEIAHKLKGLSSTSPLGIDENDFRISIAGAQEKTAFLKMNDSWYEPIGLTPTTHIFKTSIGAMGVNLNFNDSVDNEWFSLYFLKQMGLDVCHAEIHEFQDEKVLVVERFDRKWVKIKDEDAIIRLPQEDMCQALKVSPYQKYQNEGGPGIVEIANLLRASKEPNDRFNFIKALLYFDLLYATDGHAKNFSLFLYKDGFKLTPFYDVMSGYFLHKREKVPMEKLKLAMKVGDSGHYAFKRVFLKHYLETAKKCGFSNAQFDEMVDEVKQNISKYSLDKKALPKNINHATVELILEGIEKRFKARF